jgi:putative membrane protein
MKQIPYRVLMISGVVLLGGAMAMGQNRPMGSQTQQPSNTTQNNDMNSQEQQQINSEGAMQDREFVHDALQGGMAEVQLGQLAVQKGSSADVKQFGQKMVDDHTKLGDQMKQVAQQMGVKEPKDLSKKDRELIAKLQGLSGAQFDDAYIEAMVKNHKKTVSDFKQEAGNTQNSSLKQIVQQDGQIIDGHLQMIEQIAQAHSVKG